MGQDSGKEMGSRKLWLVLRQKTLGVTIYSEDYLKEGKWMVAGRGNGKRNVPKAKQKGPD